MTFFKQDATIIGQENPKLDNHHYARDFLFKKIIYMKQMKLLREEIIPLSSKQSLLLYIIIACIFQFVLFFAPTLANQAVAQNNDLLEIKLKAVEQTLIAYQKYSNENELALQDAKILLKQIEKYKDDKDIYKEVVSLLSQQYKIPQYAIKEAIKQCENINNKENEK